MLGLTNIVLYAGIACEEETTLSILNLESKDISKGGFEFIRASL